MNIQEDPRVIRQRELTLLEVVRNYPGGLLENARSKKAARNAEWQANRLAQNPSLTDEVVEALPHLDWNQYVLGNKNLSSELRLNALNELGIAGIYDLDRYHFILQKIYIDAPIANRLLEMLIEWRDSDPVSISNDDIFRLIQELFDTDEVFNTDEVFVDFDGMKVFMESEYARAFGLSEVRYTSSECAIWLIERAMNEEHRWIIDDVQEDEGEYSNWWNIIHSIPSTDIESLTYIANLIYGGRIQNLIDERFSWLLVYLEDPVHMLKWMIDNIQYRFGIHSLLLILNRCHSPIISHLILDRYPNEDHYCPDEYGYQSLLRDANIDDELAARLLRNPRWGIHHIDILENDRVSDQVKIDFIYNFEAKGTVRDKDYLSKCAMSPRNSYINKLIISILGNDHPLKILIDDYSLKDLNCEWAIDGTYTITVHDIQSIYMLMDKDLTKIRIVYDGLVDSEFLKLCKDKKLRKALSWDRLTRLVDYSVIVDNPDLPWNGALLNIRTYEPSLRFRKTKRAY
jgi:hypothetical protein